MDNAIAISVDDSVDFDAVDFTRAYEAFDRERIGPGQYRWHGYDAHVADEGDWRHVALSSGPCRVSV